MTPERLKEILDSLPHVRQRQAMFDELQDAMDFAKEASLFEFIFKICKPPLQRTAPPYRPRPMAPVRRTLEHELIMMRDSGCPFDEANDIDRVMEFMSPEGNLYDLYQSELTPRQLSLLNMIRTWYRRWERDQASN